MVFVHIQMTDRCMRSFDTGAPRAKLKMPFRREREPLSELILSMLSPPLPLHSPGVSLI